MSQAFSQVRSGNMRLASDKELLDSGVSQDLVELRKTYNDKIEEGYCMFDGVKIVRAFVSNPNGYYKMFLRAADGQVIEHGIDPNKLVKI